MPFISRIVFDISGHLATSAGGTDPPPREGLPGGGGADEGVPIGGLLGGGPVGVPIEGGGGPFTDLCNTTHYHNGITQ